MIGAVWPIKLTCAAVKINQRVKSLTQRSFCSTDRCPWATKAVGKYMLRFESWQSGIHRCGERRLIAARSDSATGRCNRQASKRSRRAWRAVSVGRLCRSRSRSADRSHCYLPASPGAPVDMPINTATVTSRHSRTAVQLAVRAT